MAKALLSHSEIYKDINHSHFLKILITLFFLLFCPSHTGPKARLMLRYPDGQREQISLSSKAKLLVRTHHSNSLIFWEIHLCVRRDEATLTSWTISWPVLLVRLQEVVWLITLDKTANCCLYTYVFVQIKQIRCNILS